MVMIAIRVAVSPARTK